jgi:hypothetical protein
MTTLTMAMDSDIIEITMTDWLTTKEAAQRSGLNHQYIRRLCRETDKLNCVLKGRTYLIDPKSLDAYTKKMKHLGTQKFNWRREGD